MLLAPHPLTTPTGAAALALAEQQHDPASLAAATVLRRQFSAELAAAALAQASLRRKATVKFGAAAQTMLFTSAGLEQATRPAVARWRARRFADAGVSTVLDLGCGIGTDARAFTQAGLRVIGVEVDAETAQVAQHNLAGQDAVVLCGDAVALSHDLIRQAEAEHPGLVGVFLDPARRTERGRTWRVEQFTPPWDFVLQQLASGRPTCVKVGPGLPGELVPEDVEARWVSCDGDVVEAGLWSLPGVRAGRAATVLTSAGLTSASESEAIELGPEPRRDVLPRPVGRYVYEPNGAVLRAGLAGYLTDSPDALAPVAPGVGYLTGDQLVSTPLAIAFEVLSVLDPSEKSLRAWVRDREIGTLEIKKRAVELDPARLRKTLKLRGSHSATLIITPTLSGVRALEVRRL